VGGKNDLKVKTSLLKIVSHEKMRNIAIQLIAIFMAFIVGALILLATGYNPINAYKDMLLGAFGDIFRIGQTLTQTTPIIYTALAFLFSFKSGLFNIGAEGQFLAGAFATTLVGISFHNVPAPIHIILALAAGALIGGLWGMIPALLKTRFGAHEVITTMMLSYVALYLNSYMVNYPFKAPGWVSQTVVIAESARLPRLLQGAQLSASIFLALSLVIITQFILNRTILGYEIRATGFNPSAARNSGIDINRSMIIALVLSGSIAGLGGAGEIMGVHRRYIDGFSPGYGWDGLAVALVGGLSPIGSFFAAILFGALRSGGMIMTRATGVPQDIVFLLQALVIIFVTAPTLIRTILKKGGIRW
jgi:simple sugar transport system permease protein